MTKQQERAIARVCAHECLQRELVEALESLLVTAECVKRQADNSGKTPYTDWSSAVDDLHKVSDKARAVLARSKEQQA